MKSTGYFTSNNLKGWNISKNLRKEKTRAGGQVQACLPDSDREIFRVGLLKTVLPFLSNQATSFCSRGFTNFIFSREFHMALPYITWLSFKIFGKTIQGEYNSIALHFCKFWQHVFLFSFQSLDVRASENLSDNQIYSQSGLL